MIVSLYTFDVDMGLWRVRHVDKEQSVNIILQMVSYVFGKDLSRIYHRLNKTYILMGMWLIWLWIY